jgi:hypothetical protein
MMTIFFWIQRQCRQPNWLSGAMSMFRELVFNSSKCMAEKRSAFRHFSGGARGYLDVPQKEAEGASLFRHTLATACS